MSIEKIAIDQEKNRPQWLGLRHRDVTASAVSALFGASEYQTAYGLFLLKAGLIEEEGDEPIITEDEISLSPMGRGLLLEDPAEKMLRLLKPDWEVEKNRFYYRDAELRIGATPDLIVNDPKRGRGVVQMKNPQASYRQWVQEDGSIEPPLDYVIQTILEAHLTGAAWAKVGAFVVSHRTTLRLIEIPIHPGILDRIKFEVKGFWKRIETGENYPPDYARDGSLIAQLYPQDNGTEIDLTGDNALPEYVDLLETARAIKKTAETDEKLAKAVIAERMGDAAIARIADGRRVSNKSQNRNVSCKHMSGLFCSQSEFRVMRLVKGR